MSAAIARTRASPPCAAKAAAARDNIASTWTERIRSSSSRIAPRSTSRSAPAMFPSAAIITYIASQSGPYVSASSVASAWSCDAGDIATDGRVPRSRSRSRSFASVPVVIRITSRRVSAPQRERRVDRALGYGDTLIPGTRSHDGDGCQRSPAWNIV